MSEERRLKEWDVSIGKLFGKAVFNKTVILDESLRLIPYKFREPAIGWKSHIISDEFFYQQYKQGMLGHLHP